MNKKGSAYFKRDQSSSGIFTSTHTNLSLSDYRDFCLINCIERHSSKACKCRSYIKVCEIILESLSCFLSELWRGAFPGVKHDGWKAKKKLQDLILFTFKRCYQSQLKTSFKVYHELHSPKSNISAQSLVQLV